LLQLQLCLQQQFSGVLILLLKVDAAVNVAAGVQALRQDLSIHGAQQVLLRRASRLSKSLRCRWADMQNRVGQQGWLNKGSRNIAEYAA
jgi:hypothetical protein